MWRVFAVAAIGSACGRVGFDAVAGAGDAADAPPTIAAVGPLACGVPRVLDEPPAMPVGVGLAATADGVVAVWTTPPAPGAADRAFDGVQLVLGPDAITGGRVVASRVPREVADFGLVGDGAAPPATRYLVSASTGTGAIFVTLDAQLEVAAMTTRPGASVGHHAVAAPPAPGGRFFAGWFQDSGQAEFSALDAAGAPTGMLYGRPAEPAANAPSTVVVQHADARDVVVWNTGAGGCAVWAFEDATTAPVIADPRVYAPSGECLHPTITRHPSGKNLLLWIDASALHGQRGTDTDTFGIPFSASPITGELEIATAPTGFFFAIPLEGGKLLTEHLVADGERAGALPLGNVDLIAGAPFRLLEHGPDALLLSVGGTTDHPQVLLTRLCEP